MPAPRKHDVRRPDVRRPDVRRGQALNVMFWAGVAMAPLAILVLLFGQSSGSLRVAVTFTVLTVVLVAVSLALRPSVELLRADIEGRVLDEVDQVRLHIREDIALAGRNTHRALNERIHALAEAVAVLRAQIDELQALMRAPVRPAPGSREGTREGTREGPPGSPAVVRRTETVHVTHRTTTVDAGDDQGTVYGSRAGGDWSERRGRDERGSRRALVRDADDPYGRGRRQDDHRYDDAAYDDRRHDERRHDERGYEDRPYEDRGPADGRYEDRRYDDLAMGDRWASVRADDQGRELRVGERRSSVHSDDRGTEFRVEDRWAALRRDAARGLDDPRGDPAWEATVRSLGPRAALPAARGEPASSYADDAGERDRPRGRGRERERVSRGDEDDPRYGADRGYAGEGGPLPRPRGAHPSEYER